MAGLEHSIRAYCGRMDLYATVKGIVPQAEDVPRALAHLHQEVSEALADWRKDPHYPELHHGEEGKPEGFLAELADIVLRVCMIAGVNGLDLEHAVNEVYEWNLMNREVGHGDLPR